MKNIGIWMDKEKAHIIRVNNDVENITTVLSKIENFNAKGGSGTRFKGGPQDVVQDSKYLEREKHQFKAYFAQIIPFIKDANEIAIFGPAQAAEKFNIELKEHYKDISKKVKEVLKADSMSDNQRKALVRDYFQK